MAAIFIARVLGPAEFGYFSFLIAVLLIMVGIQTSWVGDALTALDRSHADIRRGLHVTQLALTAGGAVVGIGLALLTTRVSPATAFAYGLLVAAWQLEEYGRRIFMARLEFLRQALNDAVYLVSVLAGLSLINIALHRGGLGLDMLAMAVSSLFAFATSQLVVAPHERLSLRDLRGPGLSRVAAFGSWRAAQVGAGNITQAAIRWLVIWLASAAVMGNLQAALLVFSPMFTFLQAIGNLMFPAFAIQRRVSSENLRQWARATCALLALTAAIYAAIVLAIPSFVVHLVAGPGYAPNRVALLGWALVAVSVAFGNTYGSVALVLKRPAMVFWYRTAGSMIGLVATVAALRLGTPSLVPLASAAGASLSALLIWHACKSASYASPP